MYKELKKVVKAAEAQGFRFEPTKKGILAKSPDGIGTAATHNTPSDLNARRRQPASALPAATATVTPPPQKAPMTDIAVPFWLLLAAYFIPGTAISAILHRLGWKLNLLQASLTLVLIILTTILAILSVGVVLG